MPKEMRGGIKFCIVYLRVHLFNNVKNCDVIPATLELVVDFFRWSIIFPRFEILTATRETMLLIEGPFCQCNMCGDVEYKVCR